MEQLPSFSGDGKASASLFNVALGAGLAALLSLTPAGQALAHSGGLDKNGCHTNRKTGDYHCHRAPSVSIPVTTPQRTDPTSLRNQGGEVYYPNCAAARAAGAAPVRIGDPGYSRRLDRDGDGVGCE